METTEITTHTFGDIELRGFTDENGDPLFVAADVAKALDYRETHDMTRILAEDEIADPRLVRVSSSNQHGEFERDVEMTMITESGLYRAIFKSTKPEAENFRLWVFRKVLPSIRKTGGYHVTIPREQFNDMMSTAIKGPAIDRIRLQQTKEELSLKRAANRQMALENRVEVNNLKERIAILERKVDRLRDGGLKAKEQWDRWCNTRQWVYLDFHYLD